MGAKHVGSLPNGWRGRDRDFAPSPSALSPEGVYILGSLPSGWRGRARDFAPSPPALSPEGEGVYILGSLPNGWRGRARDFAPHSRPSSPRECYAIPGEREFTVAIRGLNHKEEYNKKSPPGGGDKF